MADAKEKKSVSSLDTKTSMEAAPLPIVVVIPPNVEDDPPTDVGKMDVHRDS
jgi:hypothetical protein